MKEERVLVLLCTIYLESVTFFNKNTHDDEEDIHAHIYIRVFGFSGFSNFIVIVTLLHV